jgi:hypothetical protein
LELLQSIRHQGRQYIGTLDESWFYWEVDLAQQCLPEDDEPGTRTTKGIYHSETMLPIGWNLHGFHLIDNSLTPICQRLIPAGKGKLVIHTDNSRCRTPKVVLDFMSQRKVRFAPHPPYSPDLAPSDSFLFDYLKRELRGSLCQTAEELLAEVRELVGGISPET